MPEIAPRVAWQLREAGQPYRGSTKLEIPQAGQPYRGSTKLEIPPVFEGEDLFDSFLGHMLGRAQPMEFAAPEDWRQLFDQARRFRDASPQDCWPDSVELLVELRLHRRTEQYVSIVLGTGHSAWSHPLSSDRSPELLRDGKPGQDALHLPV